LQQRMGAAFVKGHVVPDATVVALPVERSG
jgi:hypothetical protein